MSDDCHALQRQRRMSALLAPTVGFADTFERHLTALLSFRR